MGASWGCINGWERPNWYGEGKTGKTSLSCEDFIKSPSTCSCSELFQMVCLIHFSILPKVIDCRVFSRSLLP